MKFYSEKHLHRPQITIIGYGNTLRGDDGIGAYVVELLKNEIKNQDQIILKTLHQVDISEAEELSESDYIFFIDVQNGKYEEDVHIKKIDPKPVEMSFTSHIISLSALLYAIQNIYNKFPVAYLCAIKGEKFDFDNQISIEAKFRAKEAVKKILQFLNRIIHLGVS